MEEIKKEILCEIEPFKENGYEFLNKNMSKMDFRSISCGFGVYAQRNQKDFVIRLRTSSGVIALDQLKKIYEWANKYEVEYLHFTTRQSIQYHGLTIDDTCSLMEEALNYNIFTRGAGGNYPRNVALSPLSGVDKNEAFDVTQYAIACDNYFMKRITSYKLPRKIKVAFSNSEEDTACCTVQDLGFMAVNNEGKKCFRVYVGGGLGRNPKKALVYPELIDANEVLYYVQGMVDFFISEGNYENKSKARIRYIVEKLGEEGFIECYKKHVEAAKAKGGLSLECEEIKNTKKGIKVDIIDNRLIEQKQEGLYSVYLHPVGGQIALENLKEIIMILETCESPEIRLSKTEGIYFRNLNGVEAKDLLEITIEMGGESDFEQSISCIGVPTCQIGICDSQDTLREMITYVKENKGDTKYLPKVYISGCGNSCGAQEIGAIGFAGKKKRVDNELLECFELFVDGSHKANEVRLAEKYGEILKRDIPKFMLELSNILKESNKSFREYISVKNDDFKELVEKYNS